MKDKRKEDDANEENIWEDVGSIIEGIVTWIVVLLAAGILFS